MKNQAKTTQQQTINENFQLLHSTRGNSIQELSELDLLEIFGGMKNDLIPDLIPD